MRNNINKTKNIKNTEPPIIAAIINPSSSY